MESSSEEKGVRAGGGGGAEFGYSSPPPSAAAQQQMIMNHQIHHHGFDSAPSEIFNLTTGIEMIGFPNSSAKSHSPAAASASAAMWKPFGEKSATSEPTTTDQFYHHHQQHEFSGGGGGVVEAAGMMVAAAAVEEEDPSNHNNNNNNNSSMVFSCSGNERPSQGLSLSLSSTHPSTIGLQSFELIRHHHSNHQEEMRFMNSPASTSRGAGGGFFSARPSSSSRHQEMDGLFQQQLFQVRGSRYLGPAQELLNEFCSLGTKQTDNTPRPKPHPLKSKNPDDIPSTSNTDAANDANANKPSVGSLEFMELQKRKTKLLSLLEEVDRKYRHYCDQMKAVVSSFEAVAGAGAATVYSALASKAMSRHFRCLRDGIVTQIQATKKAMGEKDPVAPGTTKGETPRLKVIDQAIRQQRAFQQMNMMETHPWRPQRGLPERSVSVLRAWLFEHFLHPYPSDVDKHILARQTGLSRSQVSNWFINARVRLWKPMVEELYTEETKDPNEDFIHNINTNNNINNHRFMMSSSSAGHGAHDLDQDNDDHNINIRLLNTTHHHLSSSADQKPSHDQLIRIDSDCLSSIITNPDRNDHQITTTRTTAAMAAAKAYQNHHHHLASQQQQGFGAFGAVELDFSSYNHHPTGAVSYGNDHHQHQQQQGGVSLTLGLQQHGGNNNGGGGVSLAFSPATQGNLFFPRDQMEECQQVQYSLLDGDQGQNLPYRNLMGAQLLHDLAG
ncbi:unnamed protein product [Linum trigynum]|uniref:Homeobox domain-containing protein n=1 Tax=Linum trigynum TaxID=586398 RepID=A0AAV2DPH7_9ROSI